MADKRMFAQLMEEPGLVVVPADNSENAPATRTRQISVNLREDQIAIIDRYFTLLYGSQARATRSQIAAVALEVLDRVLGGKAPARLDGSVLDEYVRTYGRVEARTGERT